MKTYLVTGAAGFIGSNFVKYMLQKHNDIRIVVLDALTYAGNLSTIAEDIDNDRCTFIRGNICDRALVDRLFVEYRFDVVVNFAAESHVDRSIENPQLFLQTNILGTQNLMDCARSAWVSGKDSNGYPRGGPEYGSTRFRPMRCTGRLAKKVILPKKHPCARIARTVLQRQAPTL